MTEINDPHLEVLQPSKVSSSEVYLLPHKLEVHSILLVRHFLSESVSGHNDGNGSVYSRLPLSLASWQSSKDKIVC